MRREHRAAWRPVRARERPPTAAQIFRAMKRPPPSRPDRERSSRLEILRRRYPAGLYAH